MARTRQEIRNFLNSLVGSKPVCKNNRNLDGQCVTLIKNLLEFLGAPNPYKARGNAKDVSNNLVANGIARRGDGWLRICSTPNLSRPYGHVWIDLRDETNYESNGRTRLTVTKGTRPIQQATLIINLDNYIAPDQAPSGNLFDVKNEEGTFTASVNRNIRWNHPQGQIGGVLSAGRSQRYHRAVSCGNFRYVEWKGSSGHICYTAVRRLSDNKRYGECK